MKIAIKPVSPVNLLILLLFFSVNYSFAQSSIGPRDGSVFSNDNTIGSYSFGTPGNAASNNGIYASATTLIGIFSGNTNYLRCTGFGFTLPTTAAISGILVQVRKASDNINFLTSVTDNSVRLIKNGTVIGSNRASSSDWPTSYAYYSYGSSSDKWGTTWTAADINSGDFGVAFSARINGIISLAPFANIDHVRMTVYYNIVLPLEITDFVAEAGSDRNAILKWNLPASDELVTVNIERMIAQNDWKTIASNQYGKSAQDAQYEFTDLNCPAPQAYYRLHAVTPSGKSSYSKIVVVNWNREMGKVYPNPATHTIYISKATLKETVYCTDMTGHRWIMKPEKSGSDYKIDISHLPRGSYTINFDDKRQLFIKN